LPATEALVLLPKIVTLLGRDIATLLLQTASTPAPADPDAPADAPAVSMLAKLLSDPEVTVSMFCTVCTNAVEVGNGMLLLREILRRTTCKQVRVSNGVMELSVYDAFDEHFAGELSHLLRVAIHAARASFTKPSPA
jgi:hypothetical protein